MTDYRFRLVTYLWDTEMGRETDMLLDVAKVITHRAAFIAERDHKLRDAIAWLNHSIDLWHLEVTTGPVLDPEMMPDSLEYHACIVIYDKGQAALFKLFNDYIEEAA